MKIKDLLNLDNDSLPVRLLIQSGYKIIMKVLIKSKVIQPETCKNITNVLNKRLKDDLKKDPDEQLIL